MSDRAIVIWGAGRIGRGFVGDLFDRLRIEDRWIELAQRAGALGFKYEKRYYGCGQCALAAILETVDELDADGVETAFETATGLAGGLGLAEEQMKSPGFPSAASGEVSSRRIS